MGMEKFDGPMAMINCLILFSAILLAVSLGFYNSSLYQTRFDRCIGAGMLWQGEACVK
jgi:hypothetical protein